MLEADGCLANQTTALRYFPIFQNPYPGSISSVHVFFQGLHKVQTVYARRGPESFQEAAALYRATMPFPRPFQTTLSGIEYLAHHHAIVSNTFGPGGPVVADLAEGRFGHYSGLSNLRRPFVLH